MKTILGFAMMLAAVAPLAAQEEESRKRRLDRDRDRQEDGRDRDLERRVRMLKERLGLDDEQVQKAQELYRQTSDAEKKLEEERRAKFRELLTEEQKPKYDEMLKDLQAGRGPGGPVGPGAREDRFGIGPGFIDRILETLSDNLKGELGLSDDQFGKVKTIVDELREKAQKHIEELRQGDGAVDWPEELKKFQEQMREYGDRVRELLNDEQKAKFDKLVEEMGSGGIRFGRRADRAERRERPRPSAEERVKRAMEALKIENPDETAAVKDLVLKIVEAQNALEDYDRDNRGKVDELRKNAALSDEEVSVKLREIREGRLGRDKALKDAQRALNEVVSVRQELELIRLGLLR